MARNSFMKNRWEFFNGMPGYLPILILTTLTNKQLLGLTSLTNVLIQMATLQALAYPFLTAQRRMEAQSPGTAGMLHPRYSNYLHCLYTIRKEEGLRGFYRGFPLYLIATAIVTLFVPFGAELSMHQSALYGKDRYGQISDLHEEVDAARERIEKKKKLLQEKNADSKK